jgi:hypothetical protein
VRDARIERLDKYCPDLPPALDRILRRSLRKDPSERYQTAAEFRDELADYLFETGQRVGAPDLRSFVADLFDPSPEALARLVQHSRKIAAPTRAKSKEREKVAVTAGGRRGGARALAPAKPAARPSREVADDAGDEEDRSDGVSVDADAIKTSEVNIPPEVLGDGPTAAVAPQSLTAVEEGWPANDDGERSSVRGFTPVSQMNDDGPSERQPKKPAHARAATDSEVGRFISGAPKRPPDSAGDISVITPMRFFCDLALAGETGLLRFEVPGAIKEIFLVRGSPESVNSSLPSERFGEYLVAKGVLTTGDLDLALSMLPHYNGKLGDTLVALGLLRPLDVFRLLSQQVRDRVIDVFAWTEGTFAFYRGVTNPNDSFPLGLDTFEILGAGVVNLPLPFLEQRFSSSLDYRPIATGQARVQADAFRIGPTPREVRDMLDGQRTLRAWLEQFTDADEQLTFLRSLYLLVETDLVQFD